MHISKKNNNNTNLLGFKDVVFDSFSEDKEFVHVQASVIKIMLVLTADLKEFKFMIIEYKRLKILIFVVRNVLFI